MRFFSLLVVLVISVNLSAQSEEVKAPATITKLNDEIKNKLCVQLKNYFVKADYPLVIAVGEFSSSPRLDANYSNGIKNAITVELKNIGFTVEKKAPYYLEGKYSKILSGDKGISVKISLNLMDSSFDEKLSQFPIIIDDYDDVAQTLGVTAGLGKADVAPVPPEKEKENREKYIEAIPPIKGINKKIEKNSATPSFYLNKDSDLIRSNESSTYGVKILVKDGQQYKAIRIRKNDEGRPFVDLKKGDIYKIELVNDSNYDAAAIVLIDGLNTFSFSEILDSDKKSHKHKYHIIDKHDKFLINGWEKNNEKVYEFLTGTLGKVNQQSTDSYGKGNPQSNLKRVHESGVITVSFSVIYDKNKKPNFISGTFIPDKLETVPGKEVDCDTIFVEREIGPVLDVISIRYSQYARNSSTPMFGD